MIYIINYLDTFVCFSTLLLLMTIKRARINSTVLKFINFTVAEDFSCLEQLDKMRIITLSV